MRLTRIAIANVTGWEGPSRTSAGVLPDGPDKPRTIARWAPDVAAVVGKQNA